MQEHKRSMFSIFLLLLSSSSAFADLQMPSFFSDHMVLQQGRPIPVWGWADPGDHITVALGNTTGEAVASNEGKFTIWLPAQPSGGPHRLDIRGDSTVTLTDVLIGEVWICSGQSNMEWTVNQAGNPDEEIAAANHPQIRHFKVAHKISNNPDDNVAGQWEVCSPKTAANFTAVGYYFGRHLQQTLNVPIGLLNASWGGTIAEAWTSREALSKDEDFAPILERAADFNPKNPNQASVLYNGMLKPLIPFAIRGAIWYQGESNVDRAQQYAKLFPTMIRDWRSRWGQGDFPFLFVQLAPFRYWYPDTRNCPELWEAQLSTLSLPNTGMAVTTDIGNITDIHPKNKQDVGKRLAVWALANSYGRKIVYSGPLFDGMIINGNKVHISFKHSEGGLITGSGEAPSHFTVAGADEHFVNAQARIEGKTIVVGSDRVPRPVAVRFGWRDDAEPNLFNQAGLPASPFRTDRFKMATDGRK